MTSKLPPVSVPFVDKRGLIDKNWLLFLQAITGALPDAGVGTVLDGSNTTFGQMTLFQGLDTSKGGNPAAGSLYFALDTGKIYFSSSGTWRLLSEELVGDVTKPIGSNITLLKDVFLSPGTYGGASQAPVITIDSKGRVTNLVFEQITAISAPSGLNGQLTYNNNGENAGSNGIIFNPDTQSLIFDTPEGTRESLSPLTTKGDIFVRNDTLSTRLPVGTDGQTLIAASTEDVGLLWVTNKLERRFFFGDASPWSIGTVPANRIIKEVSIALLTAFNEVSSLSVGVTDELLTADDVLTTSAGTYQTNPGIEYQVDTEIFLTIAPGLSTTGEGLVSITLQE